MTALATATVRIPIGANDCRIYRAGMQIDDPAHAETAVQQGKARWLDYVTPGAPPPAPAIAESDSPPDTDAKGEAQAEAEPAWQPDSVGDTNPE